MCNTTNMLENESFSEGSIFFFADPAIESDCRRMLCCNQETRDSADRSNLHEFDFIFWTDRPR